MDDFFVFALGTVDGHGMMTWFPFVPFADSIEDLVHIGISKHRRQFKEGKSRWTFPVTWLVRRYITPSSIR